MVELHLDRLPAGRSTLELDHQLVREDQVLHGHRVEGFTAHVRGELEVDAMDQKILVHGGFTATREMICDRSGEPFPMQYPVEVEVLVYRTPARAGADEIETDDNWVIHQPSGVVDLTEALLEAVVLDEPLHVVHPDYRDKDPEALVPTGEDEAQGESDPEAEIDPRWEALRKLRDDDGTAEVD